jgi:hypothetical protein
MSRRHRQSSRNWPKQGGGRAAGMLVGMPEPIPDVFADAELAAYVTSIRAEQGPPARQLGVAAVRQAQRLRVLAAAPGPKLAAVEDLTAGRRPVPVRLYRPVLEPRPLVVFLHGGMWVIGDLDSHDRICRRLAAQAGLAVLAVDSGGLLSTSGLRRSMTRRTCCAGPSAPRQVRRQAVRRQPGTRELGPRQPGTRQPGPRELGVLQPGQRSAGRRHQGSGPPRWPKPRRAPAWWRWPAIAQAGTSPRWPACGSGTRAGRSRRPRSW